MVKTFSLLLIIIAILGLIADYYWGKQVAPGLIVFDGKTGKVKDESKNH